MSLSERIDQLEPRERQLLSVLFGVFVVLVLLLFPILVSAMLGGKRDENASYREAIEGIHAGREAMRERRKADEQVVVRYAKPAPALAGLLANLAKENGIEIPESQDQAEVPHGKRYNERPTKIVLKKVQLLNLVKFLEALEQSGHPVTISRLNIRKRGTEVDSYDIDMTVSAFDRKEPAKKKAADNDESETEEDEG